MQLQFIDLKEHQVVFAGFFSRLGAFLIDMLLVAVVLVPLRLISFFFVTITDIGILDNPILFQFSAVDILCYVLMSAYFVLMTFCFGRTLGKMAVGIFVVSLREQDHRFSDILYRETVGRYLSTFFFIGYLISAVHPEKAALHDRICKTRVVEKVAKGPLPAFGKQAPEIPVSVAVPPSGKPPAEFSQDQTYEPCQESQEEPPVLSDNIFTDITEIHSVEQESAAKDSPESPMWDH